MTKILPDAGKLSIVEERPVQFDDYARISIAFRVAEVFDDAGIDAMAHGRPRAPRLIVEPYWKDYDSYPGGSPTAWPERFDVSGWLVFVAFLDGRRVGGAVLAIDDRQLDLCDRPGLALLWDIRVAPDMRQRGVGSALLRAAERGAAERGARALRIETQQNNTGACGFYRRNGYVLERVSRDVYPDLRNEIQLLWLKTLLPRSLAE